VNLEKFIAQRLAFSSNKAFSSLIIKIAALAVALSVAVMIIASSLIYGFRSEIKGKVFGFMGHIRITSHTSNYAFQTKAINKNQIDVQKILATKGIKHIQEFATKSGILKSKTEIEGIAFKGVGLDFDWNFFDQYIKEGKNLQLIDTVKSTSILLSKEIARKINANVGDKITAYFIQDPVRIRPFKVCGIYETGLLEYDEAYVIIDIRHIQKLYGWKENEVQGYELFLDKSEKLEALNSKVEFELIPPNLMSRTLKQINPGIFDWLSLQSLNERVIFILMLIVAVINMITALLILILERTNMIGILKTLGSDNALIRKIFIYKAIIIVGIGIVLGNFFGIGLCFIQDYFKLLKLPQESYFIENVPVRINFLTILLINGATLIICFICLLLPSYFVNKIEPVKAIRFD